MGGFKSVSRAQFESHQQEDPAPGFALQCQGLYPLDVSADRNDCQGSYGATQKKDFCKWYRCQFSLFALLVVGLKLVWSVMEAKRML